MMMEEKIRDTYPLPPGEKPCNPKDAWSLHDSPHYEFEVPYEKWLWYLRSPSSRSFVVQSDAENITLMVRGPADGQVSFKRSIWQFTEPEKRTLLDALLRHPDLSGYFYRKIMVRTVAVLLRTEMPGSFQAGAQR